MALIREYPLSPSAQKTYQHCPYCWFGSKVLKIQQQASMPAAVGKMWHKVMELYVQYLMKANLPADPNKLKEILASTMYSSEEFQPMDTEYAYDFLYTIENKFEIDPSNVLATEDRLAINRFGEPVEYLDNKSVFRGIIDLTEKSEEGNGILVTDYKFTWKKELTSIQQYEGYALLLLANYPDIEYVDVVLKLIGRDIETERSRYYRRSFDKLLRKIVYYYDLINSAVIFPRTPHPDQCQWCPILKECYQGKAYLGSASSIKEIAKEYIVVKAYMDKVKRKAEEQLELAVAQEMIAKEDTTKIRKTVTDKEKAIKCLISNEGDAAHKYLSLSPSNAEKLQYLKDYVGTQRVKNTEKTIQKIAKGELSCEQKGT